MKVPTLLRKRTNDDRAFYWFWFRRYADQIHRDACLGDALAKNVLAHSQLPMSPAFCKAVDTYIRAQNRRSDS